MDHRRPPPARNLDGSTWYYYCLYTFPTRFTFTGAAPAPVADFSFSPEAPKAGETVSFHDLSSGSPTSWLWSFGDGQTSTARNPTHAFSTAGVFNVTLKATNASGSSSKTQSVGVAVVAAPAIAFFSANPPAVVPGQQAILSWSSTGGSSASINEGVGSVPTTGSVTVTPVVGSPYTLTVSGPGGTATASLTVSAVPSTYAGTWILPSSARAAGANAFWTTDLTVMNSGSQSATVALKLLGHDGSGAGGPERTYTLPAHATLTWPDVLASVFGRETDWGPILIRSGSTTLVAQGQTWTASPTGGSYGQSVPRPRPLRDRRRDPEGPRRRPPGRPLPDERRPREHEGDRGRRDPPGPPPRRHHRHEPHDDRRPPRLRPAQPREQPRPREPRRRQHPRLELHPGSPGRGVRIGHRRDDGGSEDDPGEVRIDPANRAALRLGRAVRRFLQRRTAYHAGVGSVDGR